MNEPQKKTGRGCLFYGGIVAAVLFLAVILGVYFTYRSLQNLIAQYTDTTPMTLPVVQMSAEDAKHAQDRMQSFFQAVDDGKATQPLTVTADELNAVIETDPNLGLKGHFYVTLEENTIKAQVSMPADRLGIKALRGRYFNGSGTFAVSFHEGSLRVTTETLAAKGKTLPENFMRGFRGQNLAEQYEQDVKVRSTLDKLEAIQVGDGKVTFTPKTAK